MYGVSYTSCDDFEDELSLLASIKRLYLSCFLLMAWMIYMPYVNVNFIIWMVISRVGMP